MVYDAKYDRMNRSEISNTLPTPVSKLPWFRQSVIQLKLECVAKPNGRPV